MEDNTNKVIVTRQILQRILESEACNVYMNPNKIADLNAIFLNANDSQFLEKTRAVSLSFRKPGTTNSDYYGGIMELTLTWQPAERDLQDEDGNLWRAEKLNIQTNLNGTYNMTLEDARLRFSIMQSVMQLVESLTTSFSDPIGIRTHNNDERLIKESREDFDHGTRVCADLVIGRKLYRNMRVGAVRRLLRSTWPILEGVKPNTYKVSHNFGSRRRPLMKTFTVKITGNDSNIITRTE